MWGKKQEGKRLEGFGAGRGNVGEKGIGQGQRVGKVGEYGEG